VFPRLKHLAVASAFRHLGVLVGPGAAPQRWTPALIKFLDRAINIKAAGGGLSESLRMYGALAVSTLQYLAQFSPPPVAARRIESRAISRVTTSPMFAVPVSLVSGIFEVGLRPGVPNSETMALAAQLRAMATSRHMPRILHLIDPRADGVDDETFLHDRWLDWGATALTRGIASTILALEQVPGIVHVRPGSGLQARLYRILLPTLRDRHPLHVLRARLGHWGYPGVDLDRVVWFAELRLRQCDKFKFPPQCFGPS
jgi:hypothetical protein